MKTIKSMITAFLFVICSACNGQTPKEIPQPDEHKEPVATADSLNKPRIGVKVNKQYDDKGRIIKFDSTYSYYYSSPKGSMHLGNDSVFSSFRSFFKNNYPNLMDRHNTDVFFNDSLFKYDFFNDDYFQTRFRLNERIFEDMYQQMDSIKRNFLKHNYPNGYQKKKTI